MPRFDRDAFAQAVERYEAEKAAAREAKRRRPWEKPEPSAEERAAIARFWQEHDEAHQVYLGLNPFTGRYEAVFERQEVDYQSYGPAYFPAKSGSFLGNLKAEMESNPEWKEHYG